MKKIILLSLLLSFYFSYQYIFGQSNTISGLIVEKESLKPIGFASVYYENSSTGTISNTEGWFKIEKLTIDKKLIVSCIGYKTAKITKEKFAKDSLRILLEPEIYELSEIIVTSGAVREILKKAMNLKSQNYPNYPTIINGFYWQITKQDGHYIRFLESDLSIYRPNYRSDKKKSDILKIINAKSSQLFSVAFQLSDDVRDIKEDFKNKQFNWAYKEIAVLLKKENIKSKNIDELSKYLYLKDVAKNNYEKAIKYYQKAINVLKI